MAAKVDKINRYLFQRSLLFITLLTKAQLYIINSRHQWVLFYVHFTYRPQRWQDSLSFTTLAFEENHPNEGLAFWRHIEKKSGVGVGGGGEAFFYGRLKE